MELNQLTIREARSGLVAKKFSSRELVEACLSRIKKLEPKINAFITVCEKEALEQAKTIDTKILGYKDIKKLVEDYPLLGIPIGIKDLFLTKGIKTTAASKVLANYIPQYDATTVKRLKEAGVIILGKTNHDAWGHGSSGENSDFGPTRNPWNLDYVPGGSSSGSGAAVAAGECFGATATDTGSSIRLPAAFCNLVGLKPTYGRVSRYGIIAMASSLDSPGCITKTVFDQVLMFRVMVGKDFSDSTTPKVPVPNYQSFLGESIAGLKIGVPKEYFGEGTTPEVKKAIEDAIKKFESLGAKILDISLPHTKYAMSSYYIIVFSEISSNLARYDGIRYGFPREKFGDEARRRIMLGTYTLSAGYYEAYYLKAMRVRTLIKEDFEKAFKRVNVIVAPTSPTPPFKLGEKVDDPLLMYLSDIFVCPVNLAGIPSLNIPCGFVNGFPIGMQILGPQFSEELLFQVGYAYERETQWSKIRPKI
ncbi:Asp-tRNA(Asn)/Glu-tRNA(Gln) amidotransferase subunit GatA [Candidatus Gottesmanbacteria bacterium]|nr:Asp-tRNA(Asn)/Glu-tRNA(Gln) amidotransferase subunit GatA [Candidatus Gottesmanbacteria bacterium]